MHRRDLLRTGGAALAGGVAGATMLAQSTDNATAATVSPSGLSVSGVDRTTADGQVADVTATVTASWSYDLPAGQSPDRWTCALVATDGETQTTIDEASGDAKYLAFSGEATLSGSLLAAEGYTAAMFAAPEDGTTTTVTVGLGLRFVVANASGRELARATAATTADVQVTNDGYTAARYGSVGGDGSVAVVTPSG